MPVRETVSNRELHREGSVACNNVLAGAPRHHACLSSPAHTLASRCQRGYCVLKESVRVAHVCRSTTACC